jgi:hypothetical protein
MSMANTLARAGGGALLMALVLQRFPPAETSFFLLLLTFTQLQTILSLILVPTFGRAVAYAQAGADEADLAAAKPVPQAADRGPNRALVVQILAVARRAHLGLAGLVVVGLAAGASPFLAAPVAGLPHAAEGWLAWAVYVGVTGLMIGGSYFSSYLQGAGYLLLEQRWNAVFNLLAAVAAVAALLAGAGVGIVLAVHQAVLGLGVLRTRLLFRWVSRREGLAGAATAFPAPLWRTLWTPAWRSAVAPFFTAGVMQAVSLIYAQRVGPEPLASYLLGLSLIQTVAALSRAPFYSKIPELARRRALGDLAGQTALARRGMVRSHWLYVAAFVLLGLGATPVLRLLGSQTAFPPPALWSLLGAAFFLERFAALHLHNYSVTNHILWHYVNAGYGAITLAVTLALLPAAGTAAYPWGVLAGCLAFFAWYCPRLSYRSLGVGAWEFERSVLVPPLVALLAACAVLGLMGNGR